MTSLTSGKSTPLDNKSLARIKFSFISLIFSNAFIRSA
jgi:hypothetical protein